VLHRQDFGPAIAAGWRTQPTPVKQHGPRIVEADRGKHLITWHAVAYAIVQQECGR